MSSSKLHAGNLSFSATEASLTETFGAHGTVLRATLVTDRDTGRARGSALVERGSDEEAQAAIDALTGRSLDGRPIRVNVARAREDRGSGGGHSSIRW